MTLVENKGGLVCEQAYRWYKNERGGCSACRGCSACVVVSDGMWFIDGDGMWGIMCRVGARGYARLVVVGDG
jgi:hypothetical protein